MIPWFATLVHDGASWQKKPHHLMSDRKHRKMGSSLDGKQGGSLQGHTPSDVPSSASPTS